MEVVFEVEVSDFAAGTLGAGERFLAGALPLGQGRICHSWASGAL